MRAKRSITYTLAAGASYAVAWQPADAWAAALESSGSWTAVLGSLLAVAIVLLAIAAWRILTLSRTLDGMAESMRRAREGNSETPAAERGPKRVAAIVGEVNRLLEQQRSDEVALRGLDERFRSIAESSPAFIWMAGPDVKCEFVNAAWLEYTGRTLTDERGDGWGETLSRYDRERWKTALRQAYSIHQPFRIEYRRRRHDGAYRWFVDSGTPRYDGDGRFVGFIGSCIDIHERALSDLRVRRMADMYSALSQTNTAISRVREPTLLQRIACDIVVQFGGFNAAWIGRIEADRSRLRYLASSGPPVDAFDTIAIGAEPGQSPAIVLAMQALREGRPVVCNDLSLDGSAPTMIVSGGYTIRSAAAFPLRENASVVGVLAVYSAELDHFDEEMSSLVETLARNLSSALDSIALERERNAAEAALRHLNATLEDKVAERTRSLEVANRELEAFSYSVSHDLRAPLRSISGFTDLLLQKHGESLDAEARDHLSRVKAASVRMTTLINDLLNLARISRIELRRSTVNLSEIAQASIEQLCEGDRMRAVDVRIEPDLIVDADPGLARILLVNLLENAWKFTSNRERASIEFGREETGKGSAFYVRDNGVGFDMTYADKLFAPFQRLHGERDFPGNGIGLAIVQPIVERHGGSVWAESREGEGASFWFTFGERQKEMESATA